ncbi:MAG: DUF3857 domain-containing protein, partial [Pseudomonadota bacterium]
MLINQASARQATFDDAIATFNFNNETVDVQQDGTASITTEQQLEILNENGRDKFGSIAKYYNSDTQNFTLLEAFTILNGVKTSVAKSMIEDKPHGYQLNGFDSINRVLIAFPQVEVGSKLYLKYQLDIVKPALNGLFEYNFDIGSYIHEKNSALVINSKIPLHYQVNDPHNSINIKSEQINNSHQITVKQTKPLFISTFNEQNPVIPKSKLTSVQFSTINNHHSIIKKLAPRYESTINSELPQAYANIAEQAKEIGDEVAQINHVTSKISEIIRYMGDWRTIDGGYFPRPLATVVATGFGDCKDFASATAAILSKVGYKTNAVLVHRSVGILSTNSFLP